MESSDRRCLAVRVQGRRSRIAALAGLAALTLTACTSGSGSHPARQEQPSPSGSDGSTNSASPGTIAFAPPPPPHTSGFTSCGRAYLLQVPGRPAAATGGCAGILPERPVTLTVPAGTVLYVDITHELDGRLDYPVPEPSDSRLGLVTRRGPVVQYLALRPGTVDLVAHRTVFCAAHDPKVGSCATYRLVITAATH